MELQRPVVVIKARSSHEVRSFPTSAMSHAYSRASRTSYRSAYDSGRAPMPAGHDNDAEKERQTPTHPGPSVGRTGVERR